MKTVTVPFPVFFNARVKGAGNNLQHGLTMIDVAVPSLESQGLTIPSDSGRYEVIDGRLYSSIPLPGEWSVDSYAATLETYVKTYYRANWNNSPFKFPPFQAGYASRYFVLSDFNLVTMSDLEEKTEAVRRKARDFAFIDGKAYTCLEDPLIRMSHQDTLYVAHMDQHQDKIVTPRLGAPLVGLPVRDAETALELFGFDRATIDHARDLAAPYDIVTATPQGDWLAIQTEKLLSESLSLFIPHGSNACLIGAGDPGEVDLPEEIETLCHAGRRQLRQLRDARMAEMDVSYLLDDATALAEEFADVIENITRLRSFSTDLQQEAKRTVARIAQIRVWWTDIEYPRRVIPDQTASLEDMEVMALLTP